MRLLEIADNRWRDQMVADLRKVMKLNRHNSLLKAGPHRGIAGGAPRDDGRDQGARRRRRDAAHAAALQATGSKPRPEARQSAGDAVPMSASICCTVSSSFGAMRAIIVSRGSR